LGKPDIEELREPLSLPKSCMKVETLCEENTTITLVLMTTIFS